MPLFTRLLLCLLPLLASLAQAGVTPLAVSVSVLPQKYLVERVGGRWVKVYTMVSGGKDPHTFEPTPAQVAQLAQAQLYFATGMSFEQAWLGKLRSGKTTRVVDMRQGIKLRQQEEMLELNSGHEHEEHGGSDPHVWTSPANLRIIAATIQRELGKSLPAESQSELQQNTQNLLRDIERSEQKIKAQLAKSPVKRFMVFHPSWGYFADAYGLQQLPIEYASRSRWCSCSRSSARALPAISPAALTRGWRNSTIWPKMYWPTSNPPQPPLLPAVKGYCDDHPSHFHP